MIAPTPTRAVDDGSAQEWNLAEAFSRDDDLARLQRRFGTDVRATDVPGAEGATVPGAILHADDPSRRATLYFRDEHALSGLRMVVVTDAGSRWHLDHAIAVGMPLSRLVAINGRPIGFSGFDWDYGGAISDWNGGALAQPEDSPVRRGIRLGHGDADPDALPLGDTTFSSDDPRYPALGSIARVEEISVSFPDRDASR